MKRQKPKPGCATHAHIMCDDPACACVCHVLARAFGEVTS